VLSYECSDRRGSVNRFAEAWLRQLRRSERQQAGAVSVADVQVELRPGKSRVVPVVGEMLGGVANESSD
jgi:hypothetical protein